MSTQKIAFPLELNGLVAQTVASPPSLHELSTSAISGCPDIWVVADMDPQYKRWSVLAPWLEVGKVTYYSRRVHMFKGVEVDDAVRSLTGTIDLPS